VPLAVDYKGVHVDCGDRIDLVVEDRILLELKAVDRLLPIHEAQVRDAPETKCAGFLARLSAA
jgi:GxxExxY protein